jgi:hypothetical protein
MGEEMEVSLMSKWNKDFFKGLAENILGRAKIVRSTLFSNEPRREKNSEAGAVRMAAGAPKKPANKTKRTSSKKGTGTTKSKATKATTARKRG